MAELPILNDCPEARACSWTSHGRKHFPFRGMKRDQTRHGPARYRSGMTHDDICALEKATVRSGEQLELSEGKSEYLRQLNEIIGWDEGQDATHSFAECSGGLGQGRAFHGRPVCSNNRKHRKP